MSPYMQAAIILATTPLAAVSRAVCSGVAAGLDEAWRCGEAAAHLVLYGEVTRRRVLHVVTDTGRWGTRTHGGVA